MFRNYFAVARYYRRFLEPQQQPQVEKVYTKGLRNFERY